MDPLAGAWWPVLMQHVQISLTQTSDGQKEHPGVVCTVRFEVPTLVPTLEHGRERLGNQLQSSACVNSKAQ